MFQWGGPPLVRLKMDSATSGAGRHCPINLSRLFLYKEKLSHLQCIFYCIACCKIDGILLRAPH